MATAADDSTACGGGAGGKFRKKPFRRPQTTPYDRPPAAVRITHRNNDTTTGGWLSRIVDPASKLITTSAHKLFSSVFRKRLLPPPHPSQDEKGKPLENHLKDTVTGAPCSIQERDMIEGNTQNGGRMTDGVAELEHILNQKTFTRSEIDRLTVLLHSRTVDKIVAEGQERFELTPSEPSTVHSRQKELQVTAFGNGVNVDVALPTELAKAYMGGRSTRVSPSTLGQQSEAVGEKTPAITTLTLPRPNASTVQNPVSPAGTFQKDFVVPRLRGRSAIYSMARTPYSSVRPTLTKGLGTKDDAFDDHSLLSSQKVLKRRCSVLENDIGSIGPIRRIRQKPNLICPKPLGLPSSGTPSSGTPFTTNATISGVGEASSSKSHEDRDEKGGPFSSLHVSSKSVEMGQRILQHLHTLTPPKENSNEKKTGFAGGISGMELTPAMLHGQARKSLETVDLLKYVQHDKVCRKMESSDDLHEAEHPKFYDSNSKVLLNSSNKVYSENGEARITVKDGMLITKDTASVVITPATDVPKRNPAFQMSAHEDFLDMDDDTQLNGVASSSVNEGKTDLSAASSMQSNGKLPGQSSFSETTKAHIPSFTGMESFSDPASIKNTTVESSNTAEKGISSFSLNSNLNKTSVSSTPSTSVPDKADIHTSTISFGLKSSDKVSPLTLLTSPVMESSMAKDVTSSGFAFADAAIKSPAFNNKSTEAVDLSKQAVNSPACVPESSTSSLSSLDSCPLVSAAPSPVLCSFQSLSSGSAAESTLTASNTGANTMKAGASAADSTAINGSSNSLASSVAFPSFQPTFGGSSATSDSLTMATLDTDPAGNSKKTDLGTTQGSAHLNFQFRSPTTSNNGSSGSIFIDQVLVSTIASTSTAENISNQAAASALPASSGSSSLPVISGPLTSASAPLTSSFMFGSSSSVAASGSALNNSSSGLGFGTSSAPENGSTAGSSSSLSSGLIFGAASPPSSSVSFGTSSINGSSNGVPFGASSTSAPSVSTSSVFGYGASSSSASSEAPSLTFPFSASSAPATTTIAPSSTFSFGLSSAAPASLTAPPSTFSFGATSAPASASSAAPSSTFSFGESSTSAASSAAPSSTFSFGASSTSAASSAAPSSTFSFGASSTSAASSAAPSSTFSFGASSTSAASSAAPSSTFSFGASSTSAASSAVPSSTFSFGASSTSAASSAAPSSTFSFAASSGAPSSTFSFGASSSAPSSAFSFGASSTSASSSAPFSTFSFGGSSATASSSSIPSSPFSFGASSASVTATPAPVFPFGSQPPSFGNNASSVFSFGSNLSNDQMNMEDTMLEDSMQSPPTAATPTPTPVFGQAPTTNFSFGMSQTSASPFQFASQPNQSALPPNSFQASGSFDGGSFSLGAGGNDKSNRRIVKVKGKNRKK